MDKIRYNYEEKNQFPNTFVFVLGSLIDKSKHHTVPVIVAKDPWWVWEDIVMQMMNDKG